MCSQGHPIRVMMMTASTREALRRMSLGCTRGLTKGKEINPGGTQWFKSRSDEGRLEEGEQRSEMIWHSAVPDGARSKETLSR